MAIDVNKLIITEVAQITAFNNAGELEFVLDEIQDATISNTEETTDVTGRNGRKIASLKKKARESNKTMEEYRQLINNSNKFSDFKSKSLVDAAIEFLPDWTDWYKRVYMID